MARIPISEPLRPTTDVTTPILLPGVGFGRAAASAEQSGKFALDLELVKAEAVRQTELNNAITKTTTAYHDLDNEISLRTDHASIDVGENGFAERAQAINSQFGGDFADDRSTAEFIQKVSAIQEASRIKAMTVSDKLKASDHRASIDTAVFAAQQSAASALAAGDMDGYQNSRIIGLDAIQGGVDGLAYDSDKAGAMQRAFLSGIDADAANALVLSDPEQARERLADRSQFPDLLEKPRLSLIRSAQSELERRQSKAIAQAERWERDADRRVKANQAQAYKGLQVRAAQPDPDFSSQEFARIAPTLSTAGATFYLAVLNDKGDGVTDPEAYADLMGKAHAGRSTFLELSSAYSLGVHRNPGGISKEDFDRLSQINESALSEGDSDPSVQGHKQLLAGLDQPKRMGYTSESPGREASKRIAAVAEYDAWISEAHRTRAEHAEYVTQTLERYGALDAKSILEALPKPSDFDGTLGELRSKQANTAVLIEKLEDAAIKLDERKKAGTIQKERFDMEMHNISTWQKLLSERPQLSAPKRAR